MNPTKGPGAPPPFANKKSSAVFLALLVLAGNLVSVDAARRDLCLFVAFRACGRENPFMGVLFELCEGVVVPVCWCVCLKPPLGEAFRQDSLEGGSGSAYITHLRRANGRGDFAIRREIDLDGLPRLPTVRILQ